MVLWSVLYGSTRIYISTIGDDVRITITHDSFASIKSSYKNVYEASRYLNMKIPNMNRARSMAAGLLYPICISNKRIRKHNFRAR